MVPDPLTWNALVSVEPALPPYPEECVGTPHTACYRRSWWWNA